MLAPTGQQGRPSTNRPPGPALSLPSHRFRLTYGASDDRLHDFYLPALERSVRYRRSAGYFSSSALAVAGAGVARLVENGGSMRLLCGADLSPDDVDAIMRGESRRGTVESAAERAMLRALEREEGNLETDLEARLEIMAWLVARGRLEIRVVLPVGANDLPIPRPDSQEYYHPKEGIFEDAAGNKLAFSGSSNESLRGWRQNYETFQVFTSWEHGEGQHRIPALEGYITPIERRFESLWRGQDAGWIALPLPEAVHQDLIKRAPAKRRIIDPLERRPSPEERTAFRFVRHAPFMPGASRIGIQTAAVTPWPHQNRVIDAVVKQFPKSFLFCDEVGLGKTIEAGLALRQLIVTGRVRRSLILAPASVVRQWQEELWEKCALNFPRYERGTLIDVHGGETPLTGSPWEQADHLIASSQLAKRRDRREGVLKPVWDLVLVDEAHHARRREFGTRTPRHNHLLQLLSGTREGPGIKDRTRCLYLLTATPMQVDPVEVWDLLKLLGLEGRWGAGEDYFLRFFEELRTPPGQRDWPFLLEMTRDYFDTGGRLDPAFEERASSKLGPVRWNAVKDLPKTIKAPVKVKALDPAARHILGQMVRHHTPIRTFVWRNGRGLLHRYRERGILAERVPKRNPTNEWIAFTPVEQDLYDRIEEYISHFYRLYEERRKGLGFVMTVYRRRLTSSFHAARASLGRRRGFLMDPDAEVSGALSEEDLEQDDLGLDAAEDMAAPDAEARRIELEYLDDFIGELKALTVDSKLEFLKGQLGRIFLSRDSAILFTQYTDTMDYLRDSLRAVYGSGVACYSGRGGESWDGERWILRSKEAIKEEFRKGETIRLLLCTESASEGLNLQTCGVLINYDMPWNPMRVEQRIGRIDRIGQRHEEVHVHNYFFKDTVEAKVYERLSARIDWFEDVVGTLQPILHNVGRAIGKLAMMERDERDAAFGDTVSELESQAGSRDRTAIDLDELVDHSVPASVESASPVTLADIERLFLNSEWTRHRLQPHETIDGAYWLHPDPNNRAVTFRPPVFDRHPSSVELLTYGNPTFDDLLLEVAEPSGDESADPSPAEAGAALVLHDSGTPPVAVCVVKEKSGVYRAATFAEYEQAASKQDANWSDSEGQRAAAVLRQARARVEEEATAVSHRMRRAKLRGLREEARRILLHSAHIFEAREGLFAASGLERLRREGVPYRALIKVAGGSIPPMTPSDPYRLSLEGKADAVLTRNLNGLKEQGMEVLRRYAAASEG